MGGEEVDRGQGRLAGMEIARQWLEHSPLVRHLGVSLVSLAAGRAEVVLPYAEWIPTYGDTVHGGAIAALVDIAATAAAWSGAEVPARLRGATVSLSVEMMRPARNEDIRALARVLHRGRNLHFCDTELLRGDGQLVAKGLVTYKIG